MAVADLVLATYNPNILPEDDFQALCSEVQRCGRIMKPIIVRRLADGTNVVIDGEHNLRAARAAGLDAVPIEVMEVDDFAARRETYIRNRSGRPHMVRLGQMLGEMLKLRDVSNRELAEHLSCSEGSIRNALLYAQASDLAAGTPDDDTIAAMSVRDVRALVASMEGADGDRGSDRPSPAPAETPDLSKLKKAWNKASEPTRTSFLEWLGVAPALPLPEPAAPELPASHPSW